MSFGYPHSSFSSLEDKYHNIMVVSRSFSRRPLALGLSPCGSVLWGLTETLKGRERIAPWSCPNPVDMGDNP
jgi:hypothetical protein